jgi:hypothetical protein
MEVTVAREITWLHGDNCCQRNDLTVADKHNYGMLIYI